MVKLRGRHKLGLLAVALAALCFLVIHGFGKTYLFEFSAPEGMTDGAELIYVFPEDLENRPSGESNDISNDASSSISEIDHPVVEIAVTENLKLFSAAFDENAIVVRVESATPGVGKIIVSARREKDGEPESYLGVHKVYVHSSGLITVDSPIGDATGDVIIPYALFFFLIYAAVLSGRKYKKLSKKNFYSYYNIFVHGLTIFLALAALSQILAIPGYGGLIDTLSSITEPFRFVSFILLPFIFILSFFVMLTGIILAVKEGLTWRNFLAFILGVSLFLFTLFPDFLNGFLQGATFVDVHQEHGIATYIQTFAEAVVFMSITYIECIFISTLYVTLKAARLVPKESQDFLIILGCYARPDGEPGGILRKRIDRAFAYATEQRASGGLPARYVCSGGKGSDEKISEARAIARYLVREGEKPERIFLEERSKTTRENMLFSRNVIKKAVSAESDADLASLRVSFVTSDYHVFRAGALASNAGLNFSGIGAKTKTYFWINAFIREFIAELMEERKKHFLIFIILVLLIAVILTLSYFLA